MYEDQRSTVLAVDNLNGATILERTLRVDHVKKYRQLRTKGEDGEWKEAEDQRLNAAPKLLGEHSQQIRLLNPLIYLFLGSEDSGPESSGTSEPDIDPDDPMRDYLLQKWREERAGKKAKKAKSKGKHRNETPEERRARKERKREKKAMREVTKSEGLKGVEALLRSLDNPRR